MIKRLNKKQRITLASCLLTLLIVFIIWILNGSYVFTQTQVLVEKQDPLFGTTYKEWQNKFIWGLDLSLVISAISILISATLLFVFRDKRKAKNEISN